jgi:cysteine desulfurase/selenocysteine lyase
MEHHANIVPWLQLKERTGCSIEWIGVTKEGELDLPSLEHILKKGNVKLVSMTGLSNVLGARPPLEKILPLAKKHGAKTLVDAAQLIVHEEIDVQNLGCDFLVFSGHKLYGPMGIGVLFMKDDLARSLPPFLSDGDMIASVKKNGFSPAEPPRKFEAGTPAIAEAVGLARAVKWLSDLDRKAAEKHEASLLKKAADGLKKIPGVHLLGPDERVGCLSFTVDGVHPHDLTEVLGREGICLRAGHHCAEPLHTALGINASARLSVAIYNNEEDIDRFLQALPRILALLKK